MNKIDIGINNIVNVCMGVRNGDAVSVVYENSTSLMSNKIIDFLRAKGVSPTIIKIEELYQRPITKDIGLKIVKEIHKSSIALICIRYLHQEFNTFLLPLVELTTRSSIKMAFLFDLNEKLVTEGMNADYHLIRKLNNKLINILKPAKILRVTTKNGTDIIVNLGYKWVSLDGFPKKGKWINLPDGEVFTTPLNINGVIVIDGVIEEFDNPRFGLLLKKPVKAIIKENRVIINSIQTKDGELKKFLVNNLQLDDNANRIGEFALGTNTHLKGLIGNLTQDEKFPSVHLAWGNPHGTMTGVKWTSEQHQDAVILNTTVEVDGKIIMKDGKYQL